MKWFNNKHNIIQVRNMLIAANGSHVLVNWNDGDVFIWSVIAFAIPVGYALVMAIQGHKKSGN
jgi:hypothetical protein